MGSPGIHNKLIAEIAAPLLRPLGFQRQGRSRLWFADRCWWLAVIDFSPSGWSRGSYLNVAAKWLWRGDAVWSFDFSLTRCTRPQQFVSFENESQFRTDFHAMAQTAAADARDLFDAFPDIRAAANRLRPFAETPGLPWDLYHAAVAAFLVGRSKEAKRYFTKLGTPNVDDFPGALWLHELRSEARVLAEMCSDRVRFLALLNQQLQRSRAAFRLPPAAPHALGTPLSAV